MTLTEPLRPARANRGLAIRATFGRAGGLFPLPFLSVGQNADTRDLCCRRKREHGADTQGCCIDFARPQRCNHHGEDKPLRNHHLECSQPVRGERQSCSPTMHPRTRVLTGRDTESRIIPALASDLSPPSCAGEPSAPPDSDQLCFELQHLF